MCLAQWHDTVNPSAVWFKLTNVDPQYNTPLRSWYILVHNGLGNHKLFVDEQFGPISGTIKSRAWSVSKLFDTLMVFRKSLKSAFDKKRERLPSSREWTGTVSKTEDPDEMHNNLTDKI